MRVFLAIPISPELYPKIAELRTEFSSLKVRWLKDSNLHLTLVPPWETDAASLAQLIQKLRSVNTPNHFKVQFDHFGSGPNPKSPRLLWATGQHAPTEVLALKSELEHIVKYRSDRAYMLHATIARFSRDSLSTDTGLSQISKPIHWTMLVTEFVIMESTLTPDGAEYNIVERFKFNE